MLSIQPYFMQLAAKLTAGWEDIAQSPFAAKTLHNRAVTSDHYDRSIFQQLQRATASTRILGVDQLFRRTCGGFEPIHQFISALSSLPLPNEPSPLFCEIDLFAYTFLVGAQNFDWILPLSETNDIELAQVQVGCKEAMQALEAFERTGALPAKMSELDAQQYLSVRQILVRPSAQAERKALATLLISGPSTASNLERELSISRANAQQTLALFESIGLLTRWDVDPIKTLEATFVINKVAIPLVLFCLKETLGLDLLDNLSVLVDEMYG